MEMVTNSHGSQVAIIIRISIIHVSKYTNIYYYNHIYIYIWIQKNIFWNQVTIDGEDAENMNQLVRQVAYLNTR